MTTDQYQAQLQALLPAGAAWGRDPDAALTKLIQALADEFSRIDRRADDLTNETDPRATGELLIDWERVAGLPDSCGSSADTTAERRAVLHARVTNIGGQSRQFFINLAERLGYQITITEYRQFTAGSTAGGLLSNGDWLHAWTVGAPETAVTEFVAGGGSAGDPLRDWGNDILECAISRLAPAHTTPLFAYGG